MSAANRTIDGRPAFSVSNAYADGLPAPTPRRTIGVGIDVHPRGLPARIAFRAEESRKDEQ